jgi:NAD(P)-dependent dehydrogenase (short-subunit alcohol dehydrogenase family)
MPLEHFHHAAVQRHFDRIDLLVNSAGIYIPKPFTEYTPEDFEPSSSILNT